MKRQREWETSNSGRRAQGVLRRFLRIKAECRATFWGADGKVSVSNSVRSSFSAQITLSCHTSVSGVHLASASAASSQKLIGVVWACKEGLESCWTQMAPGSGQSRTDVAELSHRRHNQYLPSFFLRCQFILKDTLCFPDGHCDFYGFVHILSRRKTSEWARESRRVLYLSNK